MTNQFVIKDIERDLEVLSLAQGQHPWVHIALAVLEVERSGYWQKSFRSFTEWLVSYSAKLGLKESSLWRYYRAAKYYKVLSMTLEKEGIFIPSLIHLENKVSPENLEIMAKIERVMPEPEFMKLAKSVLDGTIPRNDLRKTWFAYRQALGGRTARGMGVQIPIISSPSPQELAHILEGKILTALLASKGSCLSDSLPSFFELFIQPIPELMPGERNPHIDAVVLVRIPPLNLLELHGIEIKSHNFRFSRQDIGQLKPLESYCDYAWVVFGSYESKIGVTSIPEHIGLMVADGEDIKVLRAAKKVDGSGVNVVQMYKGLIGKTKR